MVHGCGRGTNERLVVAGRVAALFARIALGQEEFFTFVGQPVATRTEAPPPLDTDAQAAFIAKSRALAPDYKTELLPPPGAK